MQEHATPQEDLAYWLSKTPEERVAAVDFLCTQYYGNDAAEQLGIQLQPVVIGSFEELSSAFATMLSARAEALMVQPLFARGHLGHD